MKYRFDHEYPTVFTTLVHGINATVLPGDDRDVPESTVTLHPGDSIDIWNADDPHHGHPFLTPVDDSGAPIVAPPKPRRRPRTTRPASTISED